jgi:hypothetical protein
MNNKMTEQKDLTPKDIENILNEIDNTGAKNHKERAERARSESGVEEEVKESDEEESDEEDRGTVRLDDPIECLKIKFPATIIIAGITETGKTTLLTNIIYLNRNQFHRIWLLSPFAHKEIYDYIPKKYKITDPTDVDLENIFQEQENNPEMRTCIICDDCIGRINFSRGRISKLLATTGRHVNVSFIIVNQYLNDINPLVRDNAKILFVTKVKGHCIDTIYKLTGAFYSKQYCFEFLQNTCKDYRVVRFDLSGYHAFF